MEAEANISTESTNPENVCPLRSTSRGTRSFFTPKLAAALDCAKATDRDATRILIAAAEGFGECYGVDISDLILNRTSLQNYRGEFRREKGEQLSKNFKFPDADFLIVHWDGKLLPAITGNEKIDRIAILVTHNGEEQLLGVPAIPSSSGFEQAKIVHTELTNWNVAEKVQAFCCDTTSSNTGHLSGACVHLEQLLERDCLLLACRHHVYELVLKGIFEGLLGPTSGPDTPIFKRFKEAWDEIKSKNIKTGIRDAEVEKAIEDVKDNLVIFLKRSLEKKFARDDYKEFLQLTLIFLGEVKEEDVKFSPPGPIHHARWMAKAIYSLKIFLFREHFKLTKGELNGIRIVCIFLVKLYVKAWFRVPFATEAPYQDLKFLKDLHNFSLTVNKKAGVAGLKKFLGHLWYLNPELAALGLFDSTVPYDIKEKMAKNITSGEEDENIGVTIKKVTLYQNQVPEYMEKELDYFVSPESLNLFKRINLKPTFLNQNPKIWEKDANFSAAKKFFEKLSVVNDSAERGVKLISEYNTILTKDEDQKQFILKIVKDYREQFPKVTKNVLEKSFL